MRALHYLAQEADPARAAALTRQAEGSLRLFDDYLRFISDVQKAEHATVTATWRKAQSCPSIRVEPLDTVVVVPRVARWLLSGPGAARRDAPLMNVTRSQSVPLTVLEQRPDGWVVTLGAEGAPAAGDVLFWGGDPCTLAPLLEGAPGLSMAGKPAQVLQTWPLSADSMAVCLSGRIDARDLCVDGVVSECEVMQLLDGAPLVDAAGAVVGPARAALSVDKLPAAGPLVNARGVRFRWEAKGRRRGDGVWVALSGTVDRDAVVDPRLRFLDGEVTEVWTAPRHSKETTFKVTAADRERLELCLDREPPKESTLYLPLDLRHLELMRRALHQLMHGPLPHHRALLRLCEDPGRVQWPAFSPATVDEWTELTDLSRDGTDEQRRFVAMALASPDYVQLEGPPGSGKTTALCELVRQLARRGLRVLMCASTNAAIDNLMERLDGRAPEVVGLRVGQNSDDAVAHLRLDHKVDALVRRWGADERFAERAEPERRAMAERVVVAGANLVCATMAGVKWLPHLRHQEDDRDWSEAPWARPVTNHACFDVLIVDEASKTTAQELLVPAMLARRMVVVGDVNQLSPFVDADEVAAVIRAACADGGKFTDAHQRACLLAFELGELRDAGARWLVVEDPSCLDALEAEFVARGMGDELVRIDRQRRTRPVPTLTHRDLEDGRPDVLRVAAASLVLVSRELMPHVEGHLPGDLVTTRDPQGFDRLVGDSAPWLYRRHHTHDGRERRLHPCRVGGQRVDDPVMLEELAWQQLTRTWPQEVSWRMVRAHGLRRTPKARAARKVHEELARLRPQATAASGEAEALIQDVGLPSLLEIVQRGVGAHRSRLASALTLGMNHASTREAWEARFIRLTYQHRMHEHIAALPRERFYDGAALRTANTVGQRPEDGAWTFAPGLKRRLWLDVTGEVRDGVNAAEVDAVRGALEHFLQWATEHPCPRPGGWEVACLTFYAAQQRALRDMLRRLTGRSGEGRFHANGATIVCGTVDRFQGREADLVLLSLRNARKSVGFTDSPNRLNVALTRARQLLIVVGSSQTYARRGSEDHEALVAGTDWVTLGALGGGEQ